MATWHRMSTLQRLEDAATRALPVRVTYTDAHGEHTERDILPLHVDRERGHVYAQCRLRAEDRAFLLRRIGSVEPAAPSAVDDARVLHVQLPLHMRMHVRYCELHTHGTSALLHDGEFLSAHGGSVRAGDGGWWQIDGAFGGGELAVCVDEIARVASAPTDITVWRTELPGHTMTLRVHAGTVSIDGRPVTLEVS